MTSGHPLGFEIGSLCGGYMRRPVSSSLLRIGRIRSATLNERSSEGEATASLDWSDNSAHSFAGRPIEHLKSITPDALVSFLDGKSYKMFRRHLTTYGHTPQSYRERYGLPNDYPMIGQSHSQIRSQLAKKIGLCARRKGAKSAKALPTPRTKRGA